MKIDNKLIFVGDICCACAVEKKEMFTGFGDSFGTFTHREEVVVKEDVILIKVNHLYVPLEHIKNIYQYWDIMSHKSKGGVSCPDDRFYPTSWSPLWKHKYVQNLRPLFEKDGKTSLKELRQRLPIVAEAVEIKEKQLTTSTNAIEEIERQ